MRYIKKGELDYGDFKIIIYHKENNENAYFIKTHRKEIYKFFQEGYVAAGYDDFEGCYDERSMIKNYKELKIAYHGDIPIAMSIYTGYLYGLKCVGITATTDPTFRKIGVQATHEIVKIDIKLYNKFYWCECSNKIEELYRQYGEIAIPSIFLDCFFNDTAKINLLDDGFHYKRVIGGDMERK